MVGLLGNPLVGGSCPRVHLGDEAQLLQRREGAVDGGKRDRRVRILGGDQLVDLLGGAVSAAVAERRGDLEALDGEATPGLA